MQEKIPARRIGRSHLDEERSLLSYSLEQLFQGQDSSCEFQGCPPWNASPWPCECWMPKPWKGSLCERISDPKASRDRFQQVNTAKPSSDEIDVWYFLFLPLTRCRKRPCVVTWADFAGSKALSLTRGIGVTCDVAVDWKAVTCEKPFHSRHLEVAYTQRPIENLLDSSTESKLSDTIRDPYSWIQREDLSHLSCYQSQLRACA